MTTINRQDAEQEADSVRLFPQQATQPAHFPRRSYAIAVTSPAGFPITITLNDLKLDQLDDALAALLERGYLPDESSPNASAVPAAAAPGQPPVCPYHGPMKESTARPGTWFCPKKMGDGSGYCKEKFPKA